ncbi:MAG TPA: hypothetical protein VE439_08305 [Anaerolineae bacterium]|nr:hypothetical protein [Anaerolineae bacterium]
MAMFIFILILLLSMGGTALAHRPILEQPNQLAPPGPIFARAQHVLDPTQASLAIYGNLLTPDEVDIYYFTAKKNETVPVEVLVPVRPSTANFRPTIVIASTDPKFGGNPNLINLPVPLPPGSNAISISIPSGERSIFFEPFSFEKLYHGNEQQVRLTAGQTYYLLVFDQNHYTGDYTVGVGTIENFTGISFWQIIKDIIALKLGLVGGRVVPWLDILGLYLFIAGFIVGLGAVTIIDTLGLLGRTSPYWTETTIRAHKVTKPLIWVGFALALIGAIIFYRQSGPSGVATFQILIAVPLLINGAFLSFYISPRLLAREREGRANELLPRSLQTKIAVSFVISFLGWWTELFLLVYGALMLR